jgi:hypothetical protein
VFCGVIDGMLIGPVILDDHMTGRNDIYFLQNGLAEEREDVRLATRIAMCFQHYEAPSYYARIVMRHLNVTFRNRWIGRGSTINWPPTSPDLPPLNFCLWGWMKSTVYSRKVDTREELLHVIARIKESQNALLQATRRVLTRIAKCIDVDGGVFENVFTR